jgi:FkbM family methyltransferase
MSYPYQLQIVPQDSDEHSIDEFRTGVNKNNFSLNIYDVSVPFEKADLNCIKTITRPSVTVCLFDVWHDVFISRSLQSAGIWEPYIVEEFIEAVERGGSDAGVLDVGANIGYYTLLAAKLGRLVVAVEPFIDSIRRLHRAAQIDHTADSIHVVNNAIAEVRTKATLRPSGDNQGDARIELRVQECQGTCPTVIDTILLDDLVNILPFRQAVMKIDIQGYEHHAFQRASKLFDAIHFTHIFMEWMVMRDLYISANHTSHDKILVEQLIQFLFVRDFRPYSLVWFGGAPLDPLNWYSWPEDIVWHRLQTSAEEFRLQLSHYKHWPR